jgi:hypothetical protein
MFPRLPAPVPSTASRPLHLGPPHPAASTRRGSRAIRSNRLGSYAVSVYSAAVPLTPGKTVRQVTLPANESQARALGGVAEADWPAVMAAAFEATDGHLTARAIQEGRWDNRGWQRGRAGARRAGLTAEPAAQ